LRHSPRRGKRWSQHLLRYILIGVRERKGRSLPRVVNAPVAEVPVRQAETAGLMLLGHIVIKDRCSEVSRLTIAPSVQ
jgi:hypothetical protein